MAKKSGQLRLIFDTRVVNCRFNCAPTTPLTSAAAFSALEVDSGSTLYGAGGDVRNYFYMVGVPEDMANFFSLPACRAGLLGLTGRDLGDGRGPLGFNDRILPCLRILPVGFNRAVHLVQVISMECARRAGVDDSQFIMDRLPGQRIRPVEAPRVAIYLDNYFAFGADADAAAPLAGRLGSQFRRQGLSTHKESIASPCFDFCGLHFDGRRRMVRLRPARIWRIRRAIDELLAVGHCSGRLVENITGHLTWAFLLKRPAPGPAELRVRLLASVLQLRRAAQCERPRRTSPSSCVAPADHRGAWRVERHSDRQRLIRLRHRCMPPRA